MQYKEVDLCQIRRLLAIMSMAAKNTGGDPSRIKKNLLLNENFQGGVMTVNCLASGCGGELKVDLNNMEVNFSTPEGHNCLVYESAASNDFNDLLKLSNGQS